MIDKKFLKVTQTILMNSPKIFKFKNFKFCLKGKKLLGFRIVYQRNVKNRR